MRRLVRALDSVVRRATGVFEFDAAPECVLRLQFANAPHDLDLPGCQAHKGDPVLMLHLWNEHLPILPPEGPTLAWAAEFRRLLIRSFQAVAGQALADPRFAGVRAVGGIFALLPDQEDSGGARLVRRLGFAILPYQSPLGLFGEFWENWYSWWIIHAFNPPSLRRRRMFGLHRSEIWMGVDDFFRRYHTPSNEEVADEKSASHPDHPGARPDWSLPAGNPGLRPEQPGPAHQAGNG